MQHSVAASRPHRSLAFHANRLLLVNLSQLCPQPVMYAGELAQKHKAVQRVLQSGLLCSPKPCTTTMWPACAHR